MTAVILSDAETLHTAFVVIVFLGELAFRVQFRSSSKAHALRGEVSSFCTWHTPGFLSFLVKVAEHAYVLSLALFHT